MERTQGRQLLQLSNEITITDTEQPSGSRTFTPSGDSEKVVFTITVTDPCTTATIDDLVFSPSTISVTDGSTATTTFSAPNNSVMNTHNDPALLCGETSFALYADTSDNALSAPWAVLTGPVSGNCVDARDTTQDLTLIDGESSASHSV
jgi:hypothetical protein